MTEIMVVVGVIGLMAAMAVPSIRDMLDDQRVKSAIRSVADAMMLARSEAIRSGDNVFVVMIDAAGPSDPTPNELSRVGGVDIVDPIVVVNDGPAATADCEIDPGEILHRFAAEQGVNWGTTASLAATNAAPGDLGAGTANVALGSSFTDATLNPNNAASWVLFQADGLPRVFTPTGGGGCAAIGSVGRGGGAIYVSNGRRDFSAVLTPLGTVRVHGWMGGGWRQ